MEVFIAAISITMLIVNLWVLVTMFINNDFELDHYFDED